MGIDAAGAPKLTEDEKLINQAIEQSLQLTTGDGGIPNGNPLSVKREPGAYVVFQFARS